MEPAPTGALTFLLTDLEGSTRLWELYPDAMKDALRWHDAILRAAIETSAGQVVKTTGDGMMAVFGSAVRATEASLAAQLALQAARWTETGPLRVRMGIHCGLAEQRGGDYFGPTLNRTARIMAAGHDGLRPVPRRASPPLAPGLRGGARPCGPAAGSRRGARIPDLDGGGHLPARRRAGRSRSVR